VTKSYDTQSQTQRRRYSSSVWVTIQSNWKWRNFLLISWISRDI